MARRRSWHNGGRGWAVAFGAALAVAATSASAMTINPDIKRTKETRGSAENPLWISRADCETGNDLQFTITLDQATFTTGDAISVWFSQTAEDGCNDAMTRNNSGLCKQILAPFTATQQTPPPITIGAREMSEALGANGCEWDGATTDQKATLWFLLFSAGTTTTVDDYKTWSTSIDLLGPNPPTNIKVGVGENKLHVTYDLPNEAEKPAGYYYFCDDGMGSVDGGAGGSGGGSGEGGAGGAASSATSAGGSSECTSSVLVPGKVPDLTKLKTCGKVQGGDGYTDKLTNGVKYSIAVAAYDQTGNVGRLSELECQTPQPVDDFFDTYREAGGRAGGGLCAVSAPSSAPSPWTLMTAGVGAAAVALGVRRSARARRAKRVRA